MAGCIAISSDCHLPDFRYCAWGSFRVFSTSTWASVRVRLGLVVGVFGVAMTLVGAILGGMLVARFNVMRILLIGGILAAATNLLFAWLAEVGYSLVFLTLVISADNLSAGLATAAFVAYLSSLTNVSYSATQYALFSSVMLLLPKFLGGFSGVMVDSFGYPAFFLITASIGVPVIFLILLAMRYVPAPSLKRNLG